jgi:Domain of unknown function (DUF5664)
MEKFDSVKTTEKQETFITKSVRGSREGKGRFDLIPPDALRRLAIHYENGSKVYGDKNWELGQPLSRYLDSAMRHLVCILEGMTDEDHPSAVAWNAFAYIHTLNAINAGKLPEGLDDLGHSNAGTKKENQ